MSACTYSLLWMYSNTSSCRKQEKHIQITTEKERRGGALDIQNSWFTNNKKIEDYLQFGFPLGRQFWMTISCYGAQGSSGGHCQSAPSPWTCTCGYCTQRSQNQKTWACRDVLAASLSSSLQCVQAWPASCSSASQQRVGHCCVVQPWWHILHHCPQDHQCYWMLGRSHQNHPHLKQHCLVICCTSQGTFISNKKWLAVPVTEKEPW